MVEVVSTFSTYVVRSWFLCSFLLQPNLNTYAVTTTSGEIPHWSCHNPREYEEEIQYSGMIILLRASQKAMSFMRRSRVYSSTFYPRRHRLLWLSSLPACRWRHSSSAMQEPQVSSRVANRQHITDMTDIRYNFILVLNRLFQPTLVNNCA
jgi:hypothetical protein